VLSSDFADFLVSLDALGFWAVFFFDVDRFEVVFDEFLADDLFFALFFPADFFFEVLFERRLSCFDFF